MEVETGIKWKLRFYLSHEILWMLWFDEKLYLKHLLSSFLMVSKASFITSIFFLGISPVSKNFNRSSTCSFNLEPKILVACSAKQSILEAMEHLLAKNREIRPLFLAAARPIKEEWKINPYFGVFPFFFKARNKAFSAPKK